MTRRLGKEGSLERTVQHTLRRSSALAGEGHEALARLLRHYADAAERESRSRKNLGFAKAAMCAAGLAASSFLLAQREIAGEPLDVWTIALPLATFCGVLGSLAGYLLDKKRITAELSCVVRLIEGQAAGSDEAAAPGQGATDACAARLRSDKPPVRDGPVAPLEGRNRDWARGHRVR